MTSAIQFFITLQIKNRRVFWMGIIGSIPVVLSLLSLLANPILKAHNIALYHLFPQFNFFLYLHLLLPALAIFTGVALTRDWIEDQTLPYLLVRPLPQWKLLFSKWVAYSCFPCLTIMVSLFLTYSVFKLHGGLNIWWLDIIEYLQSVAVHVLGFLAYFTLFAFLGTWMKQAALVGLFFAFGWENLVSFWPIKIRYFTVVHYLHSLFPTFFGAKMKGLFAAMPLKFTLTNDWIAIVILLTIIGGFGGLMILIFINKEYRLERG